MCVTALKTRLRELGSAMRCACAWRKRASAPAFRFSQPECPHQLPAVAGTVTRSLRSESHSASHAATARRAVPRRRRPARSSCLGPRRASGPRPPNRRRRRPGRCCYDDHHPHRGCCQGALVYISTRTRCVQGAALLALQVRRRFQRLPDRNHGDAGSDAGAGKHWEIHAFEVGKDEDDNNTPAAGEGVGAARHGPPSSARWPGAEIVSTMQATIVGGAVPDSGRRGRPRRSLRYRARGIACGAAAAAAESGNAAAAA